MKHKKCVNKCKRIEKYHRDRNIIKTLFKVFSNPSYSNDNRCF